MSYERQKRMIDNLRARGGERHVLMLQPAQQAGLAAYVAATGLTITDALNALVAAGLASLEAPAPVVTPEPVEPPAPQLPKIAALIRDEEALWGPVQPTAPALDAASTWPQVVKAFEAAGSQFERQEIANFAIHRSLSADRARLYKTRSEKLNDTMVMMLVKANITLFLFCVANDFGDSEQVEGAMNDWFQVVDSVSVFGHPICVPDALREFGKFLRLGQ